MNRRDFLKTLIAGAGAAAVGKLFSEQPKQLMEEYRIDFWKVEPCLFEQIPMPSMADLMAIFYYRHTELFDMSIGVGDWYHPMSSRFARMLARKLNQVWRTPEGGGNFLRDSRVGRDTERIDFHTWDIKQLEAAYPGYTEFENEFLPMVKDVWMRAMEEQAERVALHFTRSRFLRRF